MSGLPEDARAVRVEVVVELPDGQRLVKALAADPAWRYDLALPLREYVGLILQRATAEAHRWVTAHIPEEVLPGSEL